MNESEETMEALNRGFDDAVHGRVPHWMRYFVR